MIKVVKRDGEVAEFRLTKITEAIKKAFKATKKDYNNEILELLSLRVTADFQPKMKDSTISVEEIQDSVEHVLEQTGYTDVAKAYILYRKQREKNPQYEKYDPGLQGCCKQLCTGRGLARKRKLHGYLFRRRSDFKQLRRHYCQLLAV